MGDFLTREIKVSARVLDAEKREVEFVGATETPCDMGDGGPPEILRMSGADFRQQLPFLNAHSRRSVLDVLGSSTSILVDPEKRALIFRVRFSQATEASRAAWELVRDGSIDSVSVGYQVKKFRELRTGEFDGWGAARVEGPAIVATKWTVRELSLVPIGADPNARKRAYGEALKEEDVKIKPNAGETREQWTARAMADAEVVKEFADEAKRRAAVDAAWDLAQPKASPPAPTAPAPQSGGSAPPAPAAPGGSPTNPGVATRSLDDELAADLEARKRLILTRCPQDLRAYCEGLLLDEPLITPEAAWARLREERVRRLPPGGTPEPKRPGAPPQATPEPSKTQPPAEVRNDLGRLIGEVRS